jgi:hypothetical protein
MAVPGFDPGRRHEAERRDERAEGTTKKNFLESRYRRWIFRFCADHGVVHPDYLELNSAQISDWEAFGEVYPYGEIREDFRAARTAYEIHRGISGKGDFSDFVLPEKLEPLDRNARFLKRMRRAIAKARK